jgi:hypothetical protein
MKKKVDHCAAHRFERIVGNPYLIALRHSCPSYIQNRVVRTMRVMAGFP